MYESFDFTNDRLDIKLNAFKDKEGEIWFIGKEVAEVLGIKDTRQALRNQVLEEDKLFLAGEEYKKFVGGIQHPPQNNKVRNITLITESGLYDLVLSSKKKEAKDFRRWVTKEVLPSIRKNGYYIDNNNITQEQLDKLQKFQMALLESFKVGGLTELNAVQFDVHGTAHIKGSKEEILAKIERYIDTLGLTELKIEF